MRYEILACFGEIPLSHIIANYYNDYFWNGKSLLNWLLNRRRLLKQRWWYHPYPFLLPPSYFYEWMFWNAGMMGLYFIWTKWLRRGQMVKHSENWTWWVCMGDETLRFWICLIKFINEILFYSNRMERNSSK